MTIQKGGHRLYSKEDVSFLQKIKSLQFLGFSLKDIKNMLQKDEARGSDLLKSLNDQKHVFEAKKLEIMNVLSGLDYLIETIEGEETVNINIFCVMLQKLIGEEDTKKWFEDHFSKDIPDELFNMSRSDEIDLDKKWTEILSDIKQLTFAGAMPTSRQSQLTIESLMELMNETAKGNLDLITEKLPSPESISFPNPFTEREEEFLKEAMEFYQANNPFVKEKK